MTTVHTCSMTHTLPTFITHVPGGRAVSGVQSLTWSVCAGQVFMREVGRQRLQDLLHQEVLRRTVNLQRRFRAVQERKSFLRMKHATCLIQVLLNRSKKKFTSSYVAKVSPALQDNAL